ncbi:hypothetical protein [Streptomyces sp. SHP 1-2]|uniref:hypothetical protein n=1 Tax=Streptomyces sp. SHP 1-2 TaxID=2769489 RepID=UPI002238D3B1|nr:hypothetical protein [Streptomyces sp. SHP 1-2]MCW5253944.1 hypothetical protein [Streptomyces sp. SHP 1-2]
MNRAGREAAVRRILAESPPRVPPGLHAEAVRRGRRALRRRAAARRLLWLVLVAAALAFTVWAAVVRPWDRPPSETVPPMTGWDRW